MLSNAYFLAKFRFDTAENEPVKNLQKFAKNAFSKNAFSKNAFLNALAQVAVPAGAAAAGGPELGAAHAARGRAVDRLRTQGPRPLGRRHVAHQALARGRVGGERRRRDDGGRL